MAVIEVKNLKKYFSTPRGVLHAVDDVTLSIEKGKTLGVVGESGCGKSTLGRTIIHLIPKTEGQILLNGKDVSNVKGGTAAGGPGKDADHLSGPVFLSGPAHDGRGHHPGAADRVQTVQAQ